MCGTAGERLDVGPPRSMSHDSLTELVGGQLVAVTFVWDYIQFQVEPSILINAYTPVTIRVGVTHVQTGQTGFADALVRQIGRTIKAASLEEGRAMLVRFDDGSVVEISIQASDYRGPEAIEVRVEGGSDIVL